MQRTAVLSPCRAFRYRLGRRWADGPPMLYVLFNPSVGDADKDDPTIRSCISIAQQSSCGAIEIVNLFAFIATDPRDLREAGYPVGIDNDLHIMQAVLSTQQEVGRVVVAWGASAEDLQRPVDVMRMLRQCGARPLCLGTTAAGCPRHPLYVRRSTPLMEFR